MNRAECDRCGETFPASCLVLIPGDDVVCKYCYRQVLLVTDTTQKKEER